MSLADRLDIIPIASIESVRFIVPDPNTAHHFFAICNRDCPPFDWFYDKESDDARAAPSPDNRGLDSGTPFQLAPISDELGSRAAAVKMREAKEFFELREQQEREDDHHLDRDARTLVRRDHRQHFSDSHQFASHTVCHHDGSFMNAV